MPKIRNVYYQTNKEVAIECAIALINEFADKYPAAIKCFQEDLESCLAHIDFPAGHHKFIRTTNLLEPGICGTEKAYQSDPAFSG